MVSPNFGHSPAPQRPSPGSGAPGAEVSFGRPGGLALHRADPPAEEGWRD